MRQNKVLGLAIAAALTMSVSSSYAGDLKIYYGGWESPTTDEDYPTADTTCDFVLGYPTYASEYMFDDPIVPDGKSCNAIDDNFDGDINRGENGAAVSTITETSGTISHAFANEINDRYIYAVYTIEEALGDGNFQAKFELTNGAQFGDNISLAAGTAMDFVASPSGTHAGATPSEGGGVTDTYVTFLVQPDENSVIGANDTTLVLRFQLMNLEALRSQGEEIEMMVSLFTSDGGRQVDGASETETVAASKRGSKIDVSAEIGTVFIDVSTGSINFVGSSIISETMVSLGTLVIENSDNKTIRDDGKQWEFITNDPQPNSGTLTIVNGNFNASLTDGVFINVDGNESYDLDTDIVADSIAVDTATWELSLTEIEAIKDAGTVELMIQADGVTEINDFSDPPEATFVITYSGGKTDVYNSKLRHIKRNGTVCSLYNVPNPNAIDGFNLRITNTSSKSGILRGTLRTMDGTVLFKNELLLAEGETIVPNQTIRLTHDDLDAINVAAGNDSGWPGRAVLTISSDVTSMEIFGLIRSNTGGPLTNMSTGASGNGCD